MNSKAPQTAEVMGKKEPRRAAAKLISLLLAITAAIGLGTALVVSLVLDDAGRAVLAGSVGKVGSDPLFMYFVAAAVILGAALLAVRLPERQPATVVVGTGFIVLLVAGVGTAPEQNAWSSLPTTRPAERRLEERAALDGNGFLSAIIPAYTALGELATDGVVVRTKKALYYVTEVSEVPVRRESYPADLAPDDERLNEEIVYAVESGGEAYSIVGRGTRYREFAIADSEVERTVFVAEDP